MSMFEATYPQPGATAAARQPGLGGMQEPAGKYAPPPPATAAPGAYPSTTGTGEYAMAPPAGTGGTEYGGTTLPSETAGYSPGVGYKSFGAGEPTKPMGEVYGVPQVRAEYPAGQPGMGGTAGAPPRVYTGESVLDQVFGTAWNLGMTLLRSVADLTAWIWRPIADTVWSTGAWTAGTVQDVLAQYPMLRAFVYVFGLITAIPAGIFLTYAAITLGICLTIAAVGVAIVEGIALGIGLLVLGPILFFSFWATVLAVGTYYLAYYGLNLVASSIGTTQQMGLAPTGPITGMVKELSAESARGLQGAKEMLVGA